MSHLTTCASLVLAFDNYRGQNNSSSQVHSIEIFEWALYQSWMKFEGLVRPIRTYPFDVAL
jgi:hypothetical protein